jgi:pimeloyl-ACP methyl ester carboxylesterase
VNDAFDALPPVRHAVVGGRRVAYRESGDGAPLLVLHGIGSGAASWRAQLASRPAARRIVAWDAPGYGESDPLPGAAPGAADYAAAALGLADALGLARFDLLGHSLGGIIAAALCARHPERIGRLILSSPAAGYGALPADERAQKIAPRLHDMASLGPVAMAEKRAPNMVTPAAAPDVLAHVRAVMATLRPDGYAQACRLLAGSDIFEDARAIRTPTLVLCGSHDAVTPWPGCRQIAAAIPWSHYRQLDGVGHASYIENPAQYDAALVAFLDAA